MRNLIISVIAIMMVMLPSMAEARDCSESAVAEAAMAGDTHYVDCCNHPDKAGCGGETVPATEPPPPTKVKKDKKKKDSPRVVIEEELPPNPVVVAEAPPPVVVTPTAAPPPSAVATTLQPDVEQRLKRLEGEVFGETDSGPLTKWDIFWMILMMMVVYALIFQGIPFIRSLVKRRVWTLGGFDELLRNLATELANRQMVDPNANIQSLDDLVNHLKGRQVFDPPDNEE